MIPAEAVEAITNDLLSGWTVLVEAPTRTRAREAFDAIADSLSDGVATMSSAAGKENVTMILGNELRISTYSEPGLRVILK